MIPLYIIIGSAYFIEFQMTHIHCPHSYENARSYTCCSRLLENVSERNLSEHVVAEGSCVIGTEVLSPQLLVVFLVNCNVSTLYNNSKKVFN